MKAILDLSRRLAHRSTLLDLTTGIEVDANYRWASEASDIVVRVMNIHQDHSMILPIETMGTCFRRRVEDPFSSDHSLCKNRNRHTGKSR